MKNHRSPTQSRNEEVKVELEQKSKIVIDWMQELLKEKIPGRSLQDMLEDGVVLYKILNALKPGCLRNFHRKPKMLMMKLENIGFFLNICKTRFNVPQNSLFSPQDVHDKSDDNSNILRVLTVLMLLIKEAGYNLAGLEKLPDLSDTVQEAKADTVQKVKADTVQVKADTVQVKADTVQEVKADTVQEVKADTVQEVKANTAAAEVEELHKNKLLSPRENIVEVEVKNTQNQSSNFDHAEYNHVANKGSWYIQGNLNEYVNIQSEVTSEILMCVNTELSIESKIFLLRDIVKRNNEIEENLLYASDTELRKLCFDMGLGTNLEDVPKDKERRWYVDWIVKYGRSK